MFISSFQYRIGDKEENMNHYLNKTLKFAKEDDFQIKAGIQIGVIFITIAISFIGGVATGYLMKISQCGKLNQYFTDIEFFREEEKDIFKYIEPNTSYNVEINNPYLFTPNANFIRFP